MESSNKGIYIFWGLIILVIVAVVLFFVIPRTDYALAYKSYASVNKNTYEEITEDKTYYDYIVSAKSKFGAIAGLEGKETLTCLTNIQETLTLSEDYVQMSLMFLNKSDKYIDASKSLEKSGNKLNKKINDFQSYCKTNLSSALNQSNLPMTEINDVVNGLNERYNALIEEYVKYYEKVAVVIEKYSIKTIENNPTVINAHKGIISSLKTALAEEDLSLTTTSSIYANALTVYSSVYYLTHF